MPIVRRGEPGVTKWIEPQPLGVTVDQADAALYDEFAAGRNMAGVYAVWSDPAVTNPTIRQRALAAITAPNGARMPYAHEDQTIGHLLHIRETVDGEETASLRKRFEHRPELANELARGVLFWLDATGGRIPSYHYDSRYDYQAAIRELLPIVDEELADRLYGWYLVNDLEAYWDMDSASGYQPLTALLSDRGMPRKYKEQGLAKWIEIAEREIQGTAHPRVEHERAIDCMAQFARLWTFGSAEGVDDAILTSMIAFLDRNIPGNEIYVDSFVAAQVASHITDENLRFGFGWRHIYMGPSTWRHFRIANEGDLAFVQWMQAQASARGLSHQFDAKAASLIEAYEAERATVAQKRLAEAALQLRLREA